MFQNGLGLRDARDWFLERLIFRLSHSRQEIDHA